MKSGYTYFIFFFSFLLLCNYTFSQTESSDKKTGLEEYMNCDYTMCFFDLKYIRDTANLELLQISDVELIEDENALSYQKQDEEFSGFVFPPNSIVSFYNPRDTFIKMVELPDLEAYDPHRRPRVGIKGIPMKSNISFMNNKDNTGISTYEETKYKNKVLIRDHNTQPFIQDPGIVLMVRRSDLGDNYQDLNTFLSGFEDFVYRNQHLLSNPVIGPITSNSINIVNESEMEDPALQYLASKDTVPVITSNFQLSRYILKTPVPKNESKGNSENVKATQIFMLENKTNQLQNSND